jgi:hypothetical protein
MFSAVVFSWSDPVFVVKMSLFHCHAVINNKQHVFMSVNFSVEQLQVNLVELVSLSVQVKDVSHQTFPQRVNRSRRMMKDAPFRQYRLDVFDVAFVLFVEGGFLALS